tara:strand:+ start:124 stop:360 length:237 start_codon:yes stop_codon:yes gene_type:complete
MKRSEINDASNLVFVGIGFSLKSRGLLTEENFMASVKKTGLNTEYFLDMYPKFDFFVSHISNIEDSIFRQTQNEKISN